MPTPAAALSGPLPDFALERAEAQLSRPVVAHFGLRLTEAQLRDREAQRRPGQERHRIAFAVPVDFFAEVVERGADDRRAAEKEHVPDPRPAPPLPLGVVGVRLGPCHQLAGGDGLGSAPGSPFVTVTTTPDVALRERTPDSGTRNPNCAPSLVVTLTVFANRQSL